MIWESHPWRQELCTIADRLETWRSAFEWDDDVVAFELERDVMVSAYAIRKLLEAYKLADSTVGTRIRVQSYPLLERVPDLMNWHKLDEFYDFEDEASEHLTLAALCNQLIHSFIFMRAAADDGDAEGYRAGLAGFLVASDYKRTSRLYRIDIDTLIGLLRLVGNEEVVATTMTRDSNGQWQVSNMTAEDMDRTEPDSKAELRADPD